MQIFQEEAKSSDEKLFKQNIDISMYLYVQSYVQNTYFSNHILANSKKFRSRVTYRYLTEKI